jgi:hypothetical protein
VDSKPQSHLSTEKSKTVSNALFFLSIQLIFPIKWPFEWVSCCWDFLALLSSRHFNARLWHRFNSRSNFDSFSFCLHLSL